MRECGKEEEGERGRAALERKNYLAGVARCEMREWEGLWAKMENRQNRKEAKLL